MGKMCSNTCIFAVREEVCGFNVYTVFESFNNNCSICSTLLSIPLAGNFQGRNIWSILRFCGYSPVFRAKFGGMVFFGAAKANSPQKFSPQNCVFHQFAKVISRESFPLYGIASSEDGQ